MDASVLSNLRSKVTRVQIIQVTPIELIMNMDDSCDILNKFKILWRSFEVKGHQGSNFKVTPIELIFDRNEP